MAGEIFLAVVLIFLGVIQFVVIMFQLEVWAIPEKDEAIRISDRKDWGIISMVVGWIICGVSGLGFLITGYQVFHHVSALGLFLSGIQALAIGILYRWL